MPKRALPPIVSAPVQTLRPPPSVSPLVLLLRKDWRWAGISQFLWTFSDAFGLVDWDVEALENDLDGDETELLPSILVKLLFALTYNRQITPENVFEQLRKQYMKRMPDNNPLGNIEEPIEWATLGLSVKVGVIWQLCEWQMNNPARFRALLSNEDDSVAWRIDPVGWDREGNTYYLFDDNRLWRQRKLPSRPRSQTTKKAPRPLKASRARNLRKEGNPATDARATPSSPLTPARPEQEEPVSGRRKRTQVAFYGNPTSTIEALKRGGARAIDTPTSIRGTRSSGRVNGDAGPSRIVPAGPDMSSTPSKAGRLVTTPLGTRVSRRLRDVEDEWQQIPEEWLKEEIDGRSGKASTSRDQGAQRKEKGEGKAQGKMKGGSKPEAVLEEDAESVLTELSGSSILSELPDLESVSAGRNDIDADVVGDEMEEAVEFSRTALNQVPLVEPAEETILDLDVEVAAETSATSIKDASDFPLRSGERSSPSKQVNGQHEDVDLSPQELIAVDIEDKSATNATELDDFQWVLDQASNLPPDFVEWEAVCVSLYDWRTWPEQFAGSRNPDEKALYTFLTVHVGPKVIEALVAKEQERIRQEAVVNRKRSSRIATRELEKEELLRREKAQREMEKRMDRSLAEEKRKVREEAEIVSKEQSREDRLREREERAAAREEAIIAKALAEEEAREQEDRHREARKRRREEMGLDGDAESEPERSRSGTTASRAPGGAGSVDWQLSCEVCKKNGWNIDQDEDLVSCDDCGKWQHVDCHNRLDRQEGRAKRNWDKVDFKCQECRRKAARQRQRFESDIDYAIRPLPLTNRAVVPSRVTSVSEPSRLISKPPVILPTTSLSAPHRPSNGHTIHLNISNSFAHAAYPSHTILSNAQHHITPSPELPPPRLPILPRAQAGIPPANGFAPMGPLGATGVFEAIPGIPRPAIDTHNHSFSPPVSGDLRLPSSPHVNHPLPQNRSAAPSPSPRPVDVTMVPGTGRPYGPQATPQSRSGTGFQLPPLNAMVNGYVPSQHIWPPTATGPAIPRALPTGNPGVGLPRAAKPMSLENVVNR